MTTTKTATTAAAAVRAARYDKKTALIVVDVQNDFAYAGGALAVKGGEQIVGPVNREIAAAQAAGALVVYTQDWHPAHTPHFAPDGGIWPVHCVRDTWGAGFHPLLKVVGPVVRKGVHGEDGYSGFTTADPKSGRKAPTEMAALLRKRGVDRVVVVGLATDYCVKATALDAVAAGFATRAIRRAMRAVNLRAGDGAVALAQMRKAGVKVV